MAILKENKEAKATTKPRSAKTNPVTPKKIEVKATNVGETLPEKNTDSDSNLNLAELKVAVKDISGLPARTVEVAKKIQSLGEELDELLMKEPEINKGNADLYKSLDSRASKLRTSLENERKLYVGPFNSTVAVINAMFKKFNTDIKDGIELVLEPSLKVWNKAEEERLEKARQEKERAFTERIDTLMALGAELDKEAGRYVIKSPDGNADNNMSFNAAELRSISDENFEKATRLAESFKQEKIRMEQEEVEKKEKEEKERKEKEDKLKQEKADAEKQVLQLRSQIMQMHGFENKDGIFVLHGIKYSEQSIIEMDSDTFSGIKLKVSEIAEKVKKEAEVEKRVEKLTALDFYRSGNEFVHTSNKFKYAIAVSTLENNEAFEKEIAEFEKQQAVYLIKEQTEKIRREELNNLGFDIANNSSWFYSREGYKYEMPINILECEKDGFDTLIKAFKKGKSEYENEQAKLTALKVERSNQLQQSGLKFDYQKDLFFYNYEMPGEVSGFVIKMSDVVNYSAEELKSVLEANEKTIGLDKAAKIAYDNQQAEAKKLKDAELKSDKENITAFFTMVKDEANKVVIKDESVRKMFLEGLDFLVKNTMEVIS